MFRRVMLPSLGLLASTLFASLAPAQGGQTQEGGQSSPLRYARVVGDGASVLNLADDKGVAVASLTSGSLLAVYEEHEAGWVSVEVPGGFSVWVFGKYLQPAASDGGGGDVYEVTRNAVNIRPRPASDVTNFPMPQRLHAGDRVRIISQLEPEKPLAETWCNIWSPPGVRGWLRTAATEPLESTEDGAALWATAQKVKPVTRVEEKPAPEVALEEQSRKELDRARSMLAEERKKENPDFSAVHAVLLALVADVPGTPVALEAQQELELATTLEEANALRVELEEVKAQRSADFERQKNAVIASSRKKDPLGSRFLSRGALYRRTAPDGTPFFLLTFGGKPVGELFCSTKRYDLEMYTGYDIGIQGIELPGKDGGLPRVDVGRIEVIGRR